MRIVTLLNKCYDYLGKYKSGFWIISVQKILLLLTSLMIAFSLSRIIALMASMDIEKLTLYILILSFAYVTSLLCQYIQFSLRQRVEKNSRTEIKKIILKDIMDSFLVVQRAGIGFQSARINEILYTDVNNITVLLFACMDLCIGCITIVLTGFILFSLNFYLTFILTVVFTLSAVFVFLFKAVANNYCCTARGNRSTF